MIKITTLNEFDFAIRTYNELLKISKSLHKLDEQFCNYGLTPRQEAREQNLLKRAKELANQLGLHVYHQGDPRGCSLYLVERSDDHNYTKGIAIC